MRNFILAVSFMVLFLPQVSFGANSTPAVVTPPVIVNPQEETCKQQQGAQANAFFEKQVQERNNFGKIHPDSLVKHDQHFKATLDISMRQRKGQSTAGLPTPPDEDSTFQSFVQKQQADKVAFFQKMNQQYQACINGTGSITPAGA